MDARSERLEMLRDELRQTCDRILDLNWHKQRLQEEIEELESQAEKGGVSDE